MNQSHALKRISGIALAFSMVLGTLPITAFAVEETCQHHLTHDDSCGYSEGSPCTHVCTDECYREVMECVQSKEGYQDLLDQWKSQMGDFPAWGMQGEAHVCTEESGCVKKEKQCIHTEHVDCGYEEARECTFVCRICQVQKRINELPENVTENNLSDVKQQLADIDTAMEDLTEAEQKMLACERYEETKAAVKALEEKPEESEEPTQKETQESCSCTLALSVKADDGTVGKPYSGKITAEFTPDSAQQGEPVITMLVSKGKLPEGLTLDANTGLLSGTPKSSGTYGFTVKATADGGSDHTVMTTQEITIVIAEAVPQKFSVALTGSASKVYDGTTDIPADHTLSFALTGVADGDEVSVTATFAYDDPDVGKSKAVVAKDMKLIGKDADKYQLETDTVTAAVGTITQRGLTITASDSTVSYGKVPTDFTAEGLVAGQKLTVTLKPSATNVTKHATVTPENAVVQSGEKDVTANYAITYVPGKLEITADLSPIEKLTVDNVTSADQKAIESVQKMLEDADTDGVEEETLQQWEAAEKKCEDLLERIQKVKAENDRIARELQSYDMAKVTSENKAALQKLLSDIEKQAKSQNLTEAERKTLMQQKQETQALLDRIQAANAAVNTDAIHNTLNLRIDKVERKDKEEIQQALSDLEKALEEFGGNYTAEESRKIQAQRKNLSDCLTSILKVENLEADIEKLPKSVKPDSEAAEAVRKAMAAYNDLSDHEKSMMDQKLKDKIQKLMEQATNYKITKGAQGKWSKGTYVNMSFTANGPYDQFRAVKIDGKKISGTYYFVKSGDPGTVVTLKSYYLRSLADGKHTLTVEYEDGSADCIFYVLAKGDSPGTGDSSNLYMWITTLSVSAVVLACAAAWKKRKGQ